MQTGKKMDHTKYMQKVKGMTLDSLKFVILDCKLALSAMPESENAGYYADEVSYCCMEIAKRSVA